MSSSSSDEDVSERGGESPVPDEPTHDSDSAPSHRSASPAAKPGADSDSDDGSVNVSHKRRVVDSPDDDEEDGDINKTAAVRSILGGDVSSSDDEDKKDDGKASDADSDKEGSVTGIRLYPDEEAQREEEAPPANIEAEAPAVDLNIAGFNPSFVRLPNFLSVAKKPFQKEFYEEDEEEDTLDAEGRSRLKLRVENTIRWRVGQDEQGQEIKESNAKMVKWSDGTMSVYLGSEIFDVQSLPIHEQNHLFIRQGLGLVGQAVFNHKLNLRPHSTDSHTHRKVTLSMADRTRKTGQIKVISQVGKNPDEEKKESLKKAEEELRAAYRRETQQRRTRERKYMSSSFLEGREEASDEESLNAIKRAYQKGGSRYDAPLIGASDSDSDEDKAEKKLKDAQKDSDDSDQELGRKTQKQKKIVTSDEESD